ncbi:MAG: trimethylamine methyltransferase family protein [Methanobacteriota archaeon]|nr:MAG: trimethylamine methyltransferase family protein [Euryarchaeota archaeon]
MIQGAKCKRLLNVLTDEQVDAIHEASLTILEKTGVRYDSPDAHDRLLRAGAVKHPTRNNVLTFPRSMVEDAIKRIQPYGKYYARDPENNLVFDGEHQYAHPLGGNPQMLDLETGEARQSTLKDVEDTTKIQDALPTVSSVGNFVVATDVPPELLVIKTMEATMRNTSKCTSGYALKVEEVDALAKMWAIVAGGEEELRKKPLFTVYGSPSSPLTYDEHASDVMLRGAEYGAPVDLVPCPITGGTAPITLAGGLAQQNAELLGGVMLVQTVSDKLPIQYSGRLSVMDLRSGNNVWGVPEMALMSAATVQIAHRYNMIADVYGVTTDVNGWDLQIGLERMMSALMPALAGADNLSGIGGAWGNAGSYEMLVIDDEIYKTIFRIVHGIEVDDDRMALDIIDNVGPMGNFLAQMHTMKYLKQGEMRISPLFDKRTSERVRTEGFKPLHVAAKEAVKKILKEHEVTPLDRDVDQEITKTVKEAGKALMHRA